jgi:AP-2 complex subunit mu-1
MSYRVTQNITQPFTVNAVVSESGKKVEYNIKVKSNFPSKLYAQNVVINIPAPKNAAKHTFTVKSGKVKYDPTINCLVWKFKKFTGSSSYDLTARVECISTMDEKVWSRPPITMDFQVPMFTSSGMHVRFLKVTEKSNYDTAKWVRYVAKAGSYQIRI